MKTLLAILLSVLIGSAHAATIAVTQGSGTNMLVHADGSGNNAPATVVCDATNPDNCAPVSATLGPTVNIGGVNGTALGAPSNYGTSPGAVAVPGVNAFVTNTPPVSQSGTWNVGLSTGANTVGKVDILGNSGAAMDAAGQNASSPANELLIGGQFNTTPTTITSGNISPLQLDASARLLVNCASGCGGGSGGTALGDEGTFTQGTTSFTPIGGFYNTSITNLTSGQGGSVRLLPDRAMFVNLDSVGGTAFTLGQTTASASLPVVQPTDLTPASGTITAADAASTTTTGYNGIPFYTGTPTANSAVSLALNGQASLVVQLTGTWSATVQFEISSDSGTTWAFIYAQARGALGITTPSIAATGTGGDGIFDIPVGGATNVRVRAVSYTSGTVTVKYEAAVASPPTVRAQQGSTFSVSENGTFATNDNINQVAGFSVVTGGTNGALGVGGLAASGASVSGNPVLGGCRGQNAEQTAVTNGQAVDQACDLVGKQIFQPYANKENFKQGFASSTGTSATTLIAAGAAGVKNYVTSLQCSRSDGGTSAVTITLNDSSAMVFALPNTGGGGGSNMTFPVPLATAAATAFTFTVSAATTTVYCSAQGYQGT